jgi:L-malate glycosyltransferase
MHTEKIINNNLANQSYWDDAYANHELSDEAAITDIVKDWIRQHVPETSDANCFEIGCFPGRFITLLGKMGYELNGIDLTPRVKNEFSLWLKSLGYKTGEFYHENFLNFSSQKKYDLVCSFGFIEHFTNWDEILIKHLKLVKPGGMIVIETPNFKGLFQRFIHYFLDKENYLRHYIPAMSPKKWARVCEKQGFDIIFEGYFGEFQFWVDKQPVSGWRKRFFQFLIDYYPRLRKMKPGRKAYAPYCGIVARLKSE